MKSLNQNSNFVKNHKYIINTLKKHKAEIFGFEKAIITLDALFLISSVLTSISLQFVAFILVPKLPSAKKNLSPSP